MTIGAINSGVRLALTTVREHKLRSFLTILGVIIGTGAVIGVGSIIAGLDGAISNLMRSFGPTTIIVTKTPAMGDATREERRRNAACRGDRAAWSAPEPRRDRAATPGIPAWRSRAGCQKKKTLS